MNKYTLSWFRSLPDRSVDRVLFGCGVFLSGCEIYKQLFLYYIINDRCYDWWFFPFQLCSLPMYLCLMLPLLKKGRGKTALFTFMQDYNLLGGIAALIVSDGFRHIHWTLTLHGYVWHMLLVLIGIFIWLTGRSDLTARGFHDTAPVFFLSCSAAAVINVLAPGHGQADMFYISPYHPSSQPVFHTIALHLGILPANLLYLLTVFLGGFLIHQLFSGLSRTHAAKEQK